MEIMLLMKKLTLMKTAPSLSEYILSMILENMLVFIMLNLTETIKVLHINQSELHIVMTMEEPGMTLLL